MYFQIILLNLTKRIWSTLVKRIWVNLENWLDVGFLWKYIPKWKVAQRDIERWMINFEWFKELKKKYQNRSESSRFNNDMTNKWKFTIASTFFSKWIIYGPSLSVKIYNYWLKEDSYERKWENNNFVRQEARKIASLNKPNMDIIMRVIIT